MSDGKKRKAVLVHFGNYLRTIRLMKNIGTQDRIARLLKKRGLKTSQGLIAKYEMGDTGDPNPEVLQLLAKMYSVDYVEIVLQLVEEKYALRGKKWNAVKNALPRDECSFCKLVQESIGELSSAHKH